MEHPSAVGSGARFAIGLGRLLILLSFITLFGAWMTQVTGTTLLGMTQEHFFNDAMTLALLGIAVFIDGFWHARHV